MMQVSFTQECIKVHFEEVNFKTISGGPWDPPFSSVVKRSGTDKLALQPWLLSQNFKAISKGMWR